MKRTSKKAKAARSNETGAQIARRMLTSAKGATMAQIVEATGDTQFNLLKRMEANGDFRIVRDGTPIHYKAIPKAAKKASARKAA